MNGGCTDRFLALSFQVIWLLRLSGWCHRVPACILAESLASCTPLVLLSKLFSLESAPLLDFGGNRPIPGTERSSGRDAKGLRQSLWGRLASPFPRAHILCRSAPSATRGARKRDSPSAGRGEGRGAAAPGPRESRGWALGGQLAAPPRSAAPAAGSSRLRAQRLRCHMGGGDGAAFKRPGDGARLQRVLGLGSRRAPRSLPSGGPAPPPPGHASAGPAAMSSHIAKSESKTSLLKAAAASGGSRALRHSSARDPGLRGRRLPGPCPGSPPSCGDPSSRRPLCRPVPRDEGARGSRRGLPQEHCRPRETLPPARGRDGEERGLSPALGLRGSLRSRGRGDPAPAGTPEADPFLHRLRPMLSSAFGQVRAAPLARARGTCARDPTAAARPRPCSLCPVGAHLGSSCPPAALALRHPRV